MKKVLVLCGILACSRVNAQATPPAEVEALLKKHICFTCHQVDKKLLGPAYTEVAKRKYTATQIVELIYTPQPSHWAGYPPMSPMKQVPPDDAMKIARWIVSLGKSKK